MNNMGIKMNGMKQPKKWTMASDHKYDKSHGIKEGSPKDIKLDASRGIKDTGLASALAKLGGK